MANGLARRKDGIVYIRCRKSVLLQDSTVGTRLRESLVEKGNPVNKGWTSIPLNPHLKRIFPGPKKGR